MNDYLYDERALMALVQIAAGRTPTPTNLIYALWRGWIGVTPKGAAALNEWASPRSVKLASTTTTDF